MSRDIDHPYHYNRHPSGVECIDIVEHLTFNVGNAIKYLWRAGLKTNNKAKTYADVVECMLDDLQKAKWYVEREIERISRGKSNK